MLWRWSLVCAVAPVAWGSNYFVTHEYLPPDAPLYGAAIRALPAGLLLLALSRRLPRGAWWWRSLLLGALNVGAFFVLIYLSAQLLATSVASTIMAASPVVMMLIAWALLAERPRALTAAGAAVGIGGVWLMLFRGAVPVDARGVVASASAMLMSSLGYVLTKKWGRDVDVLAATSWQLIAGGVLLLPFAVVVEGAPPVLDPAALWGFAYVTVVATAVAFAAWFAALHHVGVGTVGLVGLLNPVTGVLLGTAVAGEALTASQVAGVLLVLLGVLAGQRFALLPRRQQRKRLHVAYEEAEQRHPRAGFTPSSGTAPAAGRRASSGPPRPRWRRAGSATAPAGCSPPRGS